MRKCRSRGDWLSSRLLLAELVVSGHCGPGDLVVVFCHCGRGIPGCLGGRLVALDPTFPDCFSDAPSGAQG